MKKMEVGGLLIGKAVLGWICLGFSVDDPMLVRKMDNRKSYTTI